MPKFDERFVTLLRSLTGVQALCTNADGGLRVYHIEVVQAEANAAPYSKYPSVVYELLSDKPEYELNGRSGWRVAVFNVICFGRSSADIRTLASAVDSISASVTVADANDFGYILTEDISDQYEIPFEYEEKAMKSTVLAISLIYREE
jgi:hypothetical protein